MARDERATVRGCVARQLSSRTCRTPPLPATRRFRKLSIIERGVHQAERNPGNEGFHVRKGAPAAALVRNRRSASRCAGPGFDGRVNVAADAAQLDLQCAGKIGGGLVGLLRSRNGGQLLQTFFVRSVTWPADKFKDEPRQLQTGCPSLVKNSTNDPKPSSTHHDQSKHREGYQDEHGFKGSEFHDASASHPARDCS